MPWLVYETKNLNSLLYGNRGSPLVGHEPNNLVHIVYPIVYLVEGL